MLIYTILVYEEDNWCVRNVGIATSAAHPTDGNVDKFICTKGDRCP